MISVLSFGFLYFCISKVNWQRNIVQRCARKECETDGLRSWQGSPSPPPSRSPGLCDTLLCAEPTQTWTRSLFHICCKAMESLLCGFPCDAWGLPDAGIYIWSERKESFVWRNLTLVFASAAILPQTIQVHTFPFLSIIDSPFDWKENMKDKKLSWTLGGGNLIRMSCGSYLTSLTRRLHIVHNWHRLEKSDQYKRLV